MVRSWLAWAAMVAALSAQEFRGTITGRVTDPTGLAVPNVCGTNRYHGSAYEFNQTSALSANLFFLNAARQRQPVTRSNQYGGTIGGPVRVPGLFNGRDKLFFFLAYEGFKDSNPGTFTSAVPTAAERNGDFSALLAAGPSFQLCDPSTAVLSGSKIVRQPLAGNMIVSSRISPVAKAYLQYFPQPNQPGKPDGENNYVVPNPSVNNFASWVGRGDAAIGSRNKLFFTMHESSYTAATADVFHNPASGQYSGLDLWGGVLDDVHAFSPTLVLYTPGHHAKLCQQLHQKRRLRSHHTRFSGLHGNLLAARGDAARSLLR